MVTWRPPKVVKPLAQTRRKPGWALWIWSDQSVMHVPSLERGTVCFPRPMAGTTKSPGHPAMAGADRTAKVGQLLIAFSVISGRRVSESLTKLLLPQSRCQKKGGVSPEIRPLSCLNICPRSTPLRAPRVLDIFRVPLCQQTSRRPRSARRASRPCAHCREL